MDVAAHAHDDDCVAVVDECRAPLLLVPSCSDVSLGGACRHATPTGTPVTGHFLGGGHPAGVCEPSGAPLTLASTVRRSRTSASSRSSARAWLVCCGCV